MAHIPIKRAFILMAIILFTWPLSAEKTEKKSEAKGWTPEHILKVKRIGNVRVSPDGGRVVFTVREAVMTEDKSEYLSLYGVKLSNYFLEADVRINLPKMKMHSMSSACSKGRSLWIIL